MKKLLLILLCVPLIGAGQEDCGDKPIYKGNRFVNNYQNSKEYKAYRIELNIWEECHQLSSFDTEKGTFDYVNGVRYRAVFNEELDITSQIIKINAGVSLVGYPMRSANMKVEKKKVAHE